MRSVMQLCDVCGRGVVQPAFDGLVVGVVPRVLR